MRPGRPALSSDRPSAARAERATPQHAAVCRRRMDEAQFHRGSLATFNLGRGLRVQRKDRPQLKLLPLLESTVTSCGPRDPGKSEIDRNSRTGLSFPTTDNPEPVSVAAANQSGSHLAQRRRTPRLQDAGGLSAGRGFTDESTKSLSPSAYVPASPGRLEGQPCYRHCDRQAEAAPPRVQAQAREMRLTQRQRFKSQGHGR